MLNRNSLSLSLTMNRDIIRVPLERHAGMRRIHPRVKRKVHEDVREHRTDDSSLWSTGLPFLKRSVL